MSRKHWQDIAIALIGLWVVVSPFWLASSLERSAGLPFWTAGTTGALVLAFALSSRTWPAIRKERVMAGLGAAMALAPIVWRDEPFTRFAVSCSAAGLVAMILAAWVAVQDHYFVARRTVGQDDLRSGLPELAMPDESGRMAGGWLGPDRGPDIVTPGQHVQASGDISKG
jgi:hypothetical protein